MSERVEVSCKTCAFYFPVQPYCHPHNGEFKRPEGPTCKYYQQSASYHGKKTLVQTELPL